MTDACAPCGLRAEVTDHRGQFLSLLQDEDEPLVLLTQLLRWCRDDHRTLWEEAQHQPGIASGSLLVDDAWPEQGTQNAIGKELRRAMACALGEEPPGSSVVVARAFACKLDEHFWPSFADSFKSRSPYQPGVGDPIPLGTPDVRDLTDMTPTSPPWRLANRLDETRHVRLAGEWAVQFRVVFDYSASDALTGLVSPSTVVATCHPNQTLAELQCDAPPAEMFPVSPRDPDRQAERIDELIKLATANGASIVVLPELATTEPLAWKLESWVRRPDGPRLLVAGSYHHRQVATGRRVNTSMSWLRGHDLPLLHEKHSPGDLPKPEGIEPQGWPELRVYVGGDGFHLVVAICRDLLNPSAVHALTEVGANLVLVPAMSETLMPFVGAVANLVTSCQALVAVSNNPAVWPTEDATASRPARALVGHPGLGTLTRLVQPIEVSPGVALMRVCSGQLSWLPSEAGIERRSSGARRARPVPGWLEQLSEQVCMAQDPGQASYSDAPREAAVLVLLSQHENDVRVLLTTRASDLSRYPGMLSFPGGLVETADDGVIQAALREACEETGLETDQVEVLGVMAPMALVADRLTVFPVLGWRHGHRDRWSINYAEVDAVIEAPLWGIDQTHQALHPSASLDVTSVAPGCAVGDVTRAILDRLFGGALRVGLLDHRGKDRH